MCIQRYVCICIYIYIYSKNIETVAKAEAGLRGRRCRPSCAAMDSKVRESTSRGSCMGAELTQRLGLGLLSSLRSPSKA